MRQQSILQLLQNYYKHTLLKVLFSHTFWLRGICRVMKRIPWPYGPQNWEIVGLTSIGANQNSFFKSAFSR